VSVRSSETASKIGSTVAFFCFRWWIQSSMRCSLLLLICLGEFGTQEGARVKLSTYARTAPTFQCLHAVSEPQCGSRGSLWCKQKVEGPSGKFASSSTWSAAWKMKNDMMCEHPRQYPRSCLATPIPVFATYERIRCCFYCCMLLWTTKLGLKDNFDYWQTRSTTKQHHTVFG
jgi:hypothetical protein